MSNAVPIVVDIPYGQSDKQSFDVFCASERGLISNKISFERPNIPVPPVPQPSHGGECVIDIVVLLDGSSSVGQAGFDDQKRFVKDLASTLAASPETIRIGVVTYGTEVSAPMDLRGRTLYEIDLEVDRLEYPEGATYFDQVSTTASNTEIDRQGAETRLNARNHSPDTFHSHQIHTLAITHFVRIM